MKVKAAKTSEDTCPQCYKPSGLCVCSIVQTVNYDSSVLILQHPQEPDKTLGSARLANLCLPHSTLKTGLSWPNLSKALGKTTVKENWIVLYLGSLRVPQLPIGERPALLFANRNNKLFTREDNYRTLRAFQKNKNRGLIILDGTWSQAKTLWWRNAWLTRLQRAVVVPPAPSLYGKLRKEPRKESISSIESLAYALSILESNPGLASELISVFAGMLERFKQNRS